MIKTPKERAIDLNTWLDNKLANEHGKTIDDFDLTKTRDLAALLRIIYDDGHRETPAVVALALWNPENQINENEVVRILKMMTVSASFRLGNGFAGVWLEANGFRSLSSLDVNNAYKLREAMRENGFCKDVIVTVTKAAVGAFGEAPRKAIVEADSPRAIRIIEGVCEYYKVSLSQVQDTGRHPMVVMARATATHLIRHSTQLSFPDIAKLLGKPNHSTVITAYQRLNALIAADFVVIDRKHGVHMKLRDVLVYLRKQLGVTHGVRSTTQQSTTDQPAYQPGQGQSRPVGPEGQGDAQQPDGTVPRLADRTVAA